MIGSTVSHYKILEKLGEGGMGVVYKAQDTKLNRTVALKFLPDRVNQDEAAKARFLQEAQAAAGLNHPNICTIHGVEEADGSLFIVMEYIEGGTLREKIPFSRSDDAITIATQIGEALQEAHAKGIVHRDIKADNIMLTAKGQAKVMDFGLAKLKGAMKLTRTSSTVGTLGYMAPEQIQGGEVDHRSDIFSFGVLLFEMLTGKLPFRGEHEAAMVYSIVNEEPQAVTSLVADISPLVENLIQRCLEKAPEDRYQTMQDVVSDLRRSLKKTSRIMRSSATLRPPDPSSMSPEIPTEQPVQRTPTTSARKRALLVGGVIVAVFLVAALVVLHPWNSGVEINPGMTTRVLEIPLNDIGYHGLSGDGNWAAFPATDANGNWHVYFMNTSGGEPKEITTDSLFVIESVDVSSDGSRVVYDAATKGSSEVDIFLASALGGNTRVIAQNGFLPRWRPDGKRIFFIRGLYLPTSASGKLEIWSVSSEGTDERREFIDSISVRNRVSLSVSPDEREVVWLRTFPDGLYQEVVVHNLASGAERQLTFNKKNIDEVCWASNNQIIFSTNKGGNTNLWIVPSLGGKELQITKGLGPDLGIKISADTKKLLYYQSQQIGDFWIGSLKTGVSRQITFDDRIKGQPVLSPDGMSVAFIMGDPDPLKRSLALYVSKRDGSNRRQLSLDNHVVSRPRWSPDGKSIAYTVLPPEGTQDSLAIAKSYMIDVERPGAPRFVADGRAFIWKDSDHLYVLNRERTWLASTRDGNVTPFFEDSTTSFMVSGEQFACYRDLHKGLEGWWVVKVDLSSNPVGKPHRILGPTTVQFSPLRDFLMYVDAAGGLWKVHLPSGVKERVRYSYPGLTAGLDFHPNPQTDEISYPRIRTRGKLVMIENPFK